MDQRAKAETFEREKAELSEAVRTRTRAYGFAPTAALRGFPSPLPLASSNALRARSLASDSF